MRRLLAILIAVPVFAAAAKTTPITVRIDFLEALAPRDTTSSEAFRREFESSINQGLKLTATSLKACGYQLESHITLYSASDTLQAKEKAEESERAGAWMIIGPRRSNHYILVATGAPKTPSVSLMAGASEVEKLGPLHLSAYATNSALAYALVETAKSMLKSKQKPTYLTVVSDDCLVCKDFSVLVDESAASRGLEKLGEVKVVTETPDTIPVVDAVLKAQPTFIVLPNYSKVSAQVMASIQNKFPSAMFLGADGWGDGQFGFVDKNPSLSTANGITVRGFPPVETGLPKFPLGKTVLAEKSRGGFSPKSGQGMAILRIIQGTKDLLCKEKPHSIESFRTIFERKGRAYFSAPWGVSAYRLTNARITYWKQAKAPGHRRASQ